MWKGGFAGSVTADVGTWPGSAGRRLVTKKTWQGEGSSWQTVARFHAEDLVALERRLEGQPPLSGSEGARGSLWAALEPLGAVVRALCLSPPASCLGWSCVRVAAFGWGGAVYGRDPTASSSSRVLGAGRLGSGAVDPGPERSSAGARRIVDLWVGSGGGPTSRAGFRSPARLSGRRLPCRSASCWASAASSHRGASRGAVRAADTGAWFGAPMGAPMVGGKSGPILGRAGRSSEGPRRCAGHCVAGQRGTSPWGRGGAEVRRRGSRAPPRRARARSGGGGARGARRRLRLDRGRCRTPFPRLARRGRPRRAARGGHGLGHHGRPAAGAGSTGTPGWAECRVAPPRGRGRARAAASPRR